MLCVANVVAVVVWYDRHQGEKILDDEVILVFNLSFSFLIFFFFIYILRIHILILSIFAKPACSDIECFSFCIHFDQQTNI